MFMQIKLIVVVVELFSSLRIVCGELLLQQL